MFKATESGIEKIKFNLFKLLILDIHHVLDSIDFYSLPYNDFFNSCTAKYGYNHLNTVVKIKLDYEVIINMILSPLFKVAMTIL